jgi:DNA-binding MarR family transcriptional regulator
MVRLTARGRRLEAAVWDAGREVERAWQERIGEPQWATFRKVLDQLAQADVEATNPPDST